MKVALGYKFYPAQMAEPAKHWVAQRIPGCERGFGEAAALVVGSPVVAVVLFHNYSPEAGVMEMSAAAESPRWMTRPVISAMHRYIFEDARCQMAVLRVSENNKRMLRIAERFGYTPYRIPRLRGRHEAEVVLTLSDDDWKVSRFNGKA